MGIYAYVVTEENMECYSSYILAQIQMFGINSYQQWFMNIQYFYMLLQVNFASVEMCFPFYKNC